MSLADLAASKILSQDVAQTVFNFEQPGAYTVVLPNHVSVVWVDGCGGGGGAGGGITGGGGGAGGGGAMACKMYPVYIPANSRKLLVTVGEGGAGGAGGAAPTIGTNGTISSLSIITNSMTYIVLGLQGGFSAAANPAVGLGGMGNYANPIYLYGTTAAPTGNNNGGGGTPQVWNTVLASVTTTGNIWSGGSGGAGGSWTGTGTGGSGGGGGASFVGSAATPGGAGTSAGAGGGGGGMCWGWNFGFGGLAPGTGPATPPFPPAIFGNGGNGGGTGQPGAPGGSGFMRLYW